MGEWKKLGVERPPYGEVVRLADGRLRALGDPDFGVGGFWIDHYGNEEYAFDSDEWQGIEHLGKECPECKRDEQPKVVRETHKLPHGFVLHSNAGRLPKGHAGRAVPDGDCEWSVGIEVEWKRVGGRVVYSSLTDLGSGDDVRDHVRETVERFRKALGG